MERVGASGSAQGAIAAIASALLACLLVAALAPSTAAAFDPALETKNFAKIQERNQYETLTPAFQTRMQQQNAQDAVDMPLLLAGDPERNPLGNVCAQRKNECAGDVRFIDWADEGYGIRTPVLFTARSGAVISGNVWRTRSGPAVKPGIVITTGSVQAPETLYWGIAAALAKRGYVVLTYDVQGQGRSDTFGEGADQQEGFPSQAGQPFYDGTEDALNFMLSTPSTHYSDVMTPSCGNGNGGVATSHVAKQLRREGETDMLSGLPHATAFNPFWDHVDPNRIGIAGHSLGAGAVSYIGQRDPRVKAIAAWDNLSHPDRRHRLPGTSEHAHGGADHQARDRLLQRLRPDPEPLHAGPRPAGEDGRLPGLQVGGRRLDGGRHPRRHPLRVLVHPRQHRQPAARQRDPARHAYGGLVHGRLDGQVRQVPRRDATRPPASSKRTTTC